MSRPPLPPFTEDSAKKKIRLAEGGWNSHDPVNVALVFTPVNRWPDDHPGLSELGL